jgi:chromosomal replication initiator protein
MLHYYVIPALKNREDIDFYKCYLDIYPERVLEEVADFYGITVDQLINGGRWRKFIIPRQMASYILRWHTSLSLKEIGDMMGGQDHTSICNSISQIDKLKDTDESVKSQYNVLVNRLS